MPVRRSLLPWLVVLAAVLVACAEGDDGADATTTSTEPSTTTTSTTTVTLLPRAIGSAAPDPEDEPETVPLDSLEVGDCVDLPGFPDPEIVEIERASLQDCDVPHHAQIYGRLLLTEDADEPYPGDEVVLSLADDVCLAEFESYVGRRYVDTRYEIVHLRPNEAAWVRGDPTVVCAVINSSFEPLVGSLMQDDDTGEDEG